VKYFLLFGLSVSVILVGYVGYYLVSPYFRVVEVNEASPFVREDFAMPSGVEALSPEKQAELEAEMVVMNASEPESMSESMPEDSEDEAMLMVLADVVGTVGHPASGMVTVIDTEEGQYLRFVNLETINGPRLHLYLAKDLEGSEYIDLGPIKGTRGNINYKVPAGVDLYEYRYVMHWCVPFGVLFNFADLRTL
jgi:hypothetical protein